MEKLFTKCDRTFREDAWRAAYQADHADRFWRRHTRTAGQYTAQSDGGAAHLLDDHCRAPSAIASREAGDRALSSSRPCETRSPPQHVDGPGPPGHLKHITAGSPVSEPRSGGQPVVGPHGHRPPAEAGTLIGVRAFDFRLST